MKPDFYDVPVNRHFDYTLCSRSAEHAEITMPLIDRYVQEEGVIQGGVISALADTAAVYIFIPSLAAGERMTSIEFKMSFLRPAMLPKGDLRARARLVKRGRTVGVSAVDVSQDGELVATGLFTYIFFPSGT